MRHILFAAALASTITLGAFAVPARAANLLVISEVLYDASGSDTDKEWIEVHNTGTASLTIIGGSGNGSWRFNDGSSHILATTPMHGSMTIPADGYAIIAANADTFLADHAGFTGTVIDTSMSLSNTSGTIKMVDGDGAVTDTVTYTNTQGAAGDGNTLQRTATNIWIAAAATPGTATLGGTTDTGDDGGSDTGATGGGGTSGGTTTTKSIESPRYKVEITAPDAMMANVAGVISAKVLLGVEERRSGVFQFSLGDGTEHKSMYPESFEHIYQFPGEYVLVFTYRSYAYQKNPDISWRKTIEVVAPEITIARVHPDGSIDISNPTDTEADLSLWRIISLKNSGAPEFVIPAETYIIAGKTLTFSPSVTGFTLSDTRILELVLPSGTIAALYNGETVETQPAKAVLGATPVSQQNTTQKTVRAAQETKIEEIPLAANALTALDDNTASRESSEKRPLAIYIISLAGIIGVALCALYFLKVFPRSGVSPLASTGSETQKIADDIRIVED